MAASLLNMLGPCSKCKGGFLRLITTKYSKSAVRDNVQYSRIPTVRLFSTLPQEDRNSEPEQKEVTADDDEFRVYEIKGLKKKERGQLKRRKMREPPPPRYKKMPIDQDWTKVWPAASSFKWSVVPFPVRQGYIKNLSENEGIIPGKYANAELMKIPNFLHLTPKHIEQHCEALKKFCTPWPEGLDTDEKCEKHFPIEVIQSDYCYSGPSIRHPKSRITTLKFKLSSLQLDYHAKDKFLRLVGDRYSKKRDMITLEVDRCPLKQQNYDFCMYLLTALYHESWKIEPWESDKQEADWEKYFWDMSASKNTAVDLVQRMKDLSQGGESEETTPQYLSTIQENSESKEEIVNMDTVQQFKQSVSELHNTGENSGTLRGYKHSVLKLMGLKPL